MLAPDSEADEARGDAPKQGETFEQAEDEGHLVERRLADHQRREDAVVDDLLRPLDDLGRE